ncbi:MAG: hypothetical protein AAB932_04985, partial [Patescibacteria group bacterium]
MPERRNGPPTKPPDFPPKEGRELHLDDFLNLTDDDAVAEWEVKPDQAALADQAKQAEQTQPADVGVEKETAPARPAASPRAKVPTNPLTPAVVSRTDSGAAQEPQSSAEPAGGVESGAEAVRTGEPPPRVVEGVDLSDADIRNYLGILSMFLVNRIDPLEKKGKITARDITDPDFVLTVKITMRELEKLKTKGKAPPFVSEAQREKLSRWFEKILAIAELPPSQQSLQAEPLAEDSKECVALLSTQRERVMRVEAGYDAIIEYKGAVERGALTKKQSEHFGTLMAGVIPGHMNIDASHLPEIVDNFVGDLNRGKTNYPGSPWFKLRDVVLRSRNILAERDALEAKEEAVAVPPRAYEILAEVAAIGIDQIKTIDDYLRHDKTFKRLRSLVQEFDSMKGEIEKAREAAKGTAEEAPASVPPDTRLSREEVAELLGDVPVGARAEPPVADATAKTAPARPVAKVPTNPLTPAVVSRTEAQSGVAPQADMAEPAVTVERMTIEERNERMEKAARKIDKRFLLKLDADGSISPAVLYYQFTQAQGGLQDQFANLKVRVDALPMQIDKVMIVAVEKPVTVTVKKKGNVHILNVNLNSDWRTAMDALGKNEPAAAPGTQEKEAVPAVEFGKPFSYDKEKAEAYGFAE